MSYLSEEDIYTNLTYMQEITDKKVQYDDPRAIAEYLESFTSNFGLATFTLASAIFLYQSKKTPSSIALRDWSKELCDKMDKRLSSMQSLSKIIGTEQRTSSFQPF